MWNPGQAQDRSRRPLSNQFLFPTLGRSSRQIGSGRDWLRESCPLRLQLSYVYRIHFVFFIDETLDEFIELQLQIVYLKLFGQKLHA